MLVLNTTRNPKGTPHKARAPLSRKDMALFTLIKYQAGYPFGKGIEREGYQAVSFNGRRFHPIKISPCQTITIGPEGHDFSFPEEAVPLRHWPGGTVMNQGRVVVHQTLRSLH